MKASPVIAAVCSAVLMVFSQAAHADDACALKETGEIPITFDAKTGRPLVAVTSGDQTMTLLLDTEAPISLISPEAAERLHAKSHSTRDLSFGLKSGGKEVATYGTIKNVTLGRATLKSADFAVAPAGVQLENDGHIGMDILSEFDIEFDFLNSKMKIFLHVDCDKSPVYWTDAYGDIPLVDNPFHYVVFNTDLDGKDTPTILGTAYRLTAMPRKIAGERFKIRPDSPEGACAKDAQKGDRFSQLNVGGLSIRNPEINSDCNHPLCPTAETVVPQLGIGINHMKKLRIFLAWKQRKIYFSPATVAS